MEDNLASIRLFSDKAENKEILNSPGSFISIILFLEELVWFRHSSAIFCSSKTKIILKKFAYLRLQIISLKVQTGAMICY